MFKVTLEVPDQILTATSDEGADYDLTVQDTFKGKTFHCSSIDAAELATIIHAVIVGVDDGPLYEAANNVLNKLGAPRECWPIP